MTREFGAADDPRIWSRGQVVFAGFFAAVAGMFQCPGPSLQRHGTTLMNISAVDVAFVVLPDGREGGRTTRGRLERKGKDGKDGAQELSQKEVCRILGLNKGVLCHGLLLYVVAK